MLMTAKAYELTTYNTTVERFECDECEANKMFEQFAHDVYMEMDLLPMSHRWAEDVDLGYTADFVDEATGEVWQVYCVEDCFYLEKTEWIEGENY